MTRAIIYLRTSSNRQIDNTSLATQEQLARNYCTAENLEVIDIQKMEAVSAKETNTERAAALLEFCKRHRRKFEVLVVYKLDRFARSQEQHHWLRGRIQAMGIQLRSATERIDESPSGKLVEGVLAAVNEYDNAVRKERVKLAMWRLMDDGIWAWGQAPPGYMREKKVDKSAKLQVPQLDESCCHHIRRMFEMYSTGLHNFQTLADYFKDIPIINWKGKRIKVGRQFMQKTITRIFYTGHMINSDGKIIAGQHPPLITMDTFQKCQQVRLEKSNHSDIKRLHNNPDFPLRRYALCGECHKPMSAAWAKGRNKKYGYYFCFTKGCSKYRKSLSKADLEREFYEHLKSIRPKKGVIELFKELVVKQYEIKMQNLQADYDKTFEEIAKLRKKRKWLLEKSMEGVISEDLLKEELPEIEKKLLITELRAGENTDKKCDVDAILIYAAAFMQSVHNIWADAPFKDQLTYQKLIYPNGVVYKDPGFTNQGLSLPFEIITSLADTSSSNVGFECIATNHSLKNIFNILVNWQRVFSSNFKKSKLIYT
ncbi:MAG: recombinase family protein [Caldilineaceae bacterium]